MFRINIIQYIVLTPALNINYLIICREECLEKQQQTKIKGEKNKEKTELIMILKFM
jgi:hypothetical protein